MPVMDELIQIFKYPPEGGAQGEKHEKHRSLSGKKTCSCSGKGGGVDEKNITEPEHGKGMNLKGRQPGNGCPGKKPPAQDTEEGSPPPPGKRLIVGAGGHSDGPIGRNTKNKRRKSEGYQNSHEAECHRSKGNFSRLGQQERRGDEGGKGAAKQIDSQRRQDE